MWESGFFYAREGPVIHYPPYGSPSTYWSVMSKRILIVEDNDVERAGLTALLQSEGYVVDAAADGRQAFCYLQHTRPNLILLDMLMPRNDGWYFLENRTRQPEVLSIPVLVVTGLGVASPSWAEEIGADGLVKKPIRIEELLNQVRAYAN
jgi:CheY-like chemotaxis protein